MKTFVLEKLKFIKVLNFLHAKVRWIVDLEQINFKILSEFPKTLWKLVINCIRDLSFEHKKLLGKPLVVEQIEKSSFLTELSKDDGWNYERCGNYSGKLIKSTTN